jgi:demethylmenaquinone methyltransferase/2-methoxy-6-polyprenyl-1,4-benzoquinol methylase
MHEKKLFDRVSFVYDIFMRVAGMYKETEVAELLSCEGHELVLDIGGGTGHYARYLSPFCKEMVVIDESDEMLSRLKSGGNIRPVCGNIFHNCYDDESFDIILLCDVLHHIENQVLLLNECRRLLKPGGNLLIYDFDYEKRMTKLIRAFESIFFSSQLLFFQKHTAIVEMLRKVGFFEIVTMKKSFYFITVWKK